MEIDGNRTISIFVELTMYENVLQILWEIG
jgi:hypothetical protein